MWNNSLTRYRAASNVLNACKASQSTSPLLSLHVGSTFSFYAKRVVKSEGIFLKEGARIALPCWFPLAPPHQRERLWLLLFFSSRRNLCIDFAQNPFSNETSPWEGVCLVLFILANNSINLSMRTNQVAILPFTPPGGFRLCSSPATLWLWHWTAGCWLCSLPRWPSLFSVC